MQSKHGQDMKSIQVNLKLVTERHQLASRVRMRILVIAGSLRRCYIGRKGEGGSASKTGSARARASESAWQSVRSAINFTQVAIVLMALVECQFVAAQTQTEKEPSSKPARVDTAKPMKWRDAIRLIGTDDPTQDTQVEKALRAALGSTDRSEVMACALVLLYVEHGDREAVMRGLSGLLKVFPKPTDETKNFVTRVRLWLWLSTSEPKSAKYAASTFREIVTATMRDALPKDDKRANAQLIGTACGMLQSQLAESPIPASDLAVASKCLSESEISLVKSTFKHHLNRNLARAAELEKIIEKVNSTDLKLIEEEQLNRKSQLAELGVDFANTRELMIEVVRNMREVIRQNTHDRRKLNDAIKGIARQWALPTEGHPGSPPVEPRKPDKSRIKVNEYEYEDDYEYKTDSKGNRYRVETQKKVRRSQSSIDREIEREYSAQMAKYPFLKTEYDQRMAVYTPLLRSWVDADATRRQKLQADRAAALTRSEELLATSKQLRTEASEAVDDTLEQRSDVEILAEQYELTDVALKSIASDSVANAFRVPHFELLDLEQEKSRLMSLAN